MVTGEVCQDKALQISRFALGRWSSNGHSLVTLGKPLHIHCSGNLGDNPFFRSHWRQNSRQWSSNLRMVLKRPFISDTGEDATLHIHQASQVTEPCISIIDILKDGI